jgi:hypothetical protein
MRYMILFRYIKIKTRLIDEMFVSVMGEYVFETEVDSMIVHGRFPEVKLLKL